MSNSVGTHVRVGHDDRVHPADTRVDELLLRPWRPDDADAVYRACQDPALQRWSFSLPVPYLREHATALVSEIAPAMQAEGMAVHLGVFAAADGELLGSTALNQLDHTHLTAEIGYWTAPWARGRRVAERASRALLRRGFDELGLKRVAWKATVGNHASRLTGLRLGFRPIGIVEGETRARDGVPVDRWVASLRPGELTAAGADVAPQVRRRARTFGAAQPRLSAPGGIGLRPPEQRDLPGIVAACRDPEATRWTTVPVPYTDADAAWFALWHAPSVWARGTGAVFVVADPEGSYAGTIDLRVSPADPDVADVGYLIAPHARGRGYATAALRVLSCWAIDVLGVQRVEWKAHLDNLASHRVAQKAGFTIEGVQRGGIAHRGERLDCRLGALLPADLLPAG